MNGYRKSLLQHVTTARANLRLVEAAISGPSVTEPDQEFIGRLLSVARDAANKAETQFRTGR